MLSGFSASIFSLLKTFSAPFVLFVQHQAFVWNFAMNIEWPDNTGNIYPMTKAAYNIYRNRRPYILLQFTLAFKMILNADKWLVFWGTVSVTWGMWPTGEGRQVGSRLGMVEIISVGVLHCLSECRIIVYCAFTGVRLSLVKSVFCIYRHTEHVFLYLQGTECAHFLMTHLYPLFQYFTFILPSNRRHTYS
jgi:hypothetical protein